MQPTSNDTTERDRNIRNIDRTREFLPAPYTLLVGTASHDGLGPSIEVSVALFLAVHSVRNEIPAVEGGHSQAAQLLPIVVGILVSHRLYLQFSVFTRFEVTTVVQFRIKVYRDVPLCR